MLPVVKCVSVYMCPWGELSGDSIAMMIGCHGDQKRMHSEYNNSGLI